MICHNCLAEHEPSVLSCQFPKRTEYFSWLKAQPGDREVKGGCGIRRHEPCGCVMIEFLHDVRPTSNGDLWMVGVAQWKLFGRDDDIQLPVWAFKEVKMFDLSGTKTIDEWRKYREKEGMPC